MGSRSYFYSYLLLINLPYVFKLQAFHEGVLPSMRSFRVYGRCCTVDLIVSQFCCGSSFKTNYVHSLQSRNVATFLCLLTYSAYTKLSKIVSLIVVLRHSRTHYGEQRNPAESCTTRLKYFFMFI